MYTESISIDARLDAGYSCLPEFVSFNDYDFDSLSRELAFWLPHNQDELDYALRGSVHYTLRHNGKIICTFGMTIIHGGVAEAWLIPSSEIKNHKTAGLRVIERWLIAACDHYDIERLHAAIDPAREKSVRFAMALGFVPEATLEKYGPHGEDYIMMKRIF